MFTTIKPTNCAGLNAKRVHIAVQKNAFGQYVTLCEGIAPHTVSGTDRAATCKRCASIAAEIFAI